MGVKEKSLDVFSGGFSAAKYVNSIRRFCTGELSVSKK